MQRSEICLTSNSDTRRDHKDSKTGWPAGSAFIFRSIKDVYRNPDAVSGLMVIKQATAACDIRELGVEGVNKIWRDARLKGAGIKRANDHGNSSGAQHWKYGAPRSARKEIRNLLEDYEGYKKRMDELMEEIEKTLLKFPI